MAFPGQEYRPPEALEIKLRSVPVRHRETGAYSLPPEETAGRVRAVGEKIGIDAVDLIDTACTDGVPIYRVNNATQRAKCHRALFLWSSPPAPLNHPVRENYGKGMTPAQSLASAMMEAVERYCGQLFPHHLVIRADYREVRQLAVHPAQFSFPALPLKCRHCPARERLCFEDLGRLDGEWAWGYSLTRQAPALVPAALVYYPYLSAGGLSFIFNDTGGLAAGNTLEEALLQGIAEIVERDSLYQAFNLENTGIMQYIDFSRDGGRHLQKFDREALPARSVFSFRISNSRLGDFISTYTAFICYQDQGSRRFFGGSGASLDPVAGLTRALTEMEQQKVRQKELRRFDPARLVRHNGHRGGQTLVAGDLPVHSDSDLKNDLEYCLAEFKKRGLDVLAVDLTHPEIGIPVVRVIIPELTAYSGNMIREELLTGLMHSFS